MEDSSSYILNGNPLRKIDDYYEVSQTVLGKGTYGTVYLAIVKGSHTKRAVKVIQKDKVNNVERFKCEVDIMKSLVGPPHAGPPKHPPTL